MPALFHSSSFCFCQPLSAQCYSTQPAWLRQLPGSEKASGSGWLWAQSFTWCHPELLSCPTGQTQAVLWALGARHQHPLLARRQVRGEHRRGRLQVTGAAMGAVTHRHRNTEPDTQTESQTHTHRDTGKGTQPHRCAPTQPH